MLTAFTAALITITLFELGDKTFFVVVVLATRHPRRLGFSGSGGCLSGHDPDLSVCRPFRLLPCPPPFKLTFITQR
ncbi:TMEM165/GDT1 family protein [Neosynechococcus sphagnicola]|uniref:TMEM165/GDT1 family protein n=1 Tax=Neosynechococcus sphagnicola TaxID=1501145 RepID=UPI0030844F31